MLYPILTPSRFLCDLSGIWNFKLDNGRGFDEKWFEEPLQDPMTMPVPASYNDLKEGIDFRDHYGWVFYQRRISLPEVIAGQRVVLRCDAVTHHAKIYLDGEMLCEHRGGFLPFEVEITDKMAQGEHLLTIAVDNVIDYTTLPVGGKGDMLGGLMGGIGEQADAKPQNHPNFDFFNYCGITRPVRLYTTPKSYIKDITLVPRVEEIARSCIIRLRQRTRGIMSRNMKIVKWRFMTGKGNLRQKAQVWRESCIWNRCISGSP